METTTTIKVPVNVPKYYSIDLLKEQLTAYAQQLIAAAKPTAKAKRPYRHEALCGIFNSEATEDQLIEDYLQEKYKLGKYSSTQTSSSNTSNGDANIRPLTNC